MKTRPRRACHSTQGGPVGPSEFTSGDQEFLQLENMNRPPKTVAAVAVCSLYFVIFRLEMSVCFF